MNTELIGTDNNTFYDKTFTNNNKTNNNININNCKINASALGKKLNWNYSYIKMRKDFLKKNSTKPLKKDNKIIISKNIIKKLNLKNNNNYNANINKKNKSRNNEVMKNNNHHINFMKYTMNNAKFTNEQLLSKYYGYFKKNVKK